MAKVKDKPKTVVAPDGTLRRPTAVRKPTSSKPRPVRTRAKAGEPPEPYHRPAGPLKRLRLPGTLPVLQMQAWTVAFVDSSGVVKAKIGPFTSRREANVAAKRVLLDIRRKMGGPAKVQAIKSASVTERRKLESCNVKIVPGDVGYVYGAGTALQRKAIIGRDVAGLTLRLNPRRKNLQCDVSRVRNPKKRRKNTHLAVGRSVAYKGHKAEVVQQLPRDRYIVRFASSGSLMTVSGRSLK